MLGLRLELVLGLRLGLAGEWGVAGAARHTLVFARTSAPPLSSTPIVWVWFFSAAQ